MHLDIKPDNLLVASDGRLILTDFGTAMELQVHQPTPDSQLGKLQRGGRGGEGEGKGELKREKMGDI